MPHYLLVAYKPESTWYGNRGATETYPADFFIANMLERPALIQELAKHMAENMRLNQDEAEWDFWIYKDGICIMAASQCGTNIWDGNVKFDSMPPGGVANRRDADIEEAEDIWGESQKLAEVLDQEHTRRCEEKKLQDAKDAREREYKKLADEFNGSPERNSRYARYLELSKEFGSSQLSGNPGSQSGS